MIEVLERLGVPALHAREAMEFALATVIVSVMVRVALHESPPRHEIGMLDPHDDMDRERQARDPRPACRAIAKVLHRARLVCDSRLQTDPVVDLDEQMRFLGH